MNGIWQETIYYQSVRLSDEREREFLAAPFSGLLPPSFRLTYRHIYYFILFIFVQGVHRTTPTPRAYIIFHAHKIFLYCAKYIRHVPILVWSCNRSIYTCFYIYLLMTRHILVFWNTSGKPLLHGISPNPYHSLDDTDFYALPTNCRRRSPETKDSCFTHSSDIGYRMIKF